MTARRSSTNHLSAARIDLTAIGNLFAANCANLMEMGLSRSIEVCVVNRDLLDAEQIFVGT